MVVAYWQRGPSAADYAWVTGDHPGHTDPQVDYAARHTFDYAYDGAGNWPFNTAYAAPLAGGPSFVTRLRSLREAERFIAAGIPLVASISFGSGDLDGSPISGTNGHLLVIAGFTESGDVVVNDPAIPASTTTTLGPVPTDHPAPLVSAVIAESVMKNMACENDWAPACRPTDIAWAL